MARWAHPLATVDEGALFGEDIKVWHFAHVSAGAPLGDGGSLGPGVYVGNDVSICDRVTIQNNVSVYGAVTLEDDMFCGNSLVFTRVMNPRAAVHKNESRRTLDRRGAVLPAGGTGSPACPATDERFQLDGNNLTPCNSPT